MHVIMNYGNRDHKIMTNSILTKDLIGKQLDWAVAVALGVHWSENGYFVWPIDDQNKYPYRATTPNYSTDWAIGGVVADQHDISMFGMNTWGEGHCAHYHERKTDRGVVGKLTARGYGPTKLIAAMRCLVEEKIGSTVEVPTEITQ